MKYYSEELKKIFDSEEELKSAELKAKEAAEKKRKEELEATNTKKQMAKKVDEAEACVKEAYDNLKKAQDECAKILEDADDKVKAIYDKADSDCKAIMTPVKEKLAECQRAKLTAIEEFNKKYGPYTVSLTGDKALKEFENWNSWFNTIFKTLL